MAGSKGLSGVGVGVAAAGGLLMYAGIRDVGVLDALRQITSGKLPKGNKDRDGQPGEATTQAEQDLATMGLGAIASAGQGVAGIGGPMPDLASAAMAYLGVPYRWGGRTRAGMDCSGLVFRAFADLGIKAPGNTYTQQPWSKLKTIAAASAGAGDLVFWTGHVAIYLGGGQVVHAPHAGAVVRTEQADQAGPKGGGKGTYKRYIGPGGGKSSKKKPKTAEA